MKTKTSVYLDLSAPLTEKTPVYPGDPQTVIKSAGVLERDGYVDHVITMGNHTGTHIDAPGHMVAAGRTLDQISLDQFIGRGCLINVIAGFTLEGVQRAGIQQGDIVLFHTGMSALYHDPIYFKAYPVMSEAIARHLIERKVKVVGVDAGSVDGAEGFPIHKLLLNNDILIIENLMNLEQLMGKGFKVFALPVKLQVDAAPARVIAEVNI